jgi:hypothetical protein
MQSQELVASPLGENLHAAIVIIANPAGNTQHVRLTLDKPAEPDPLNTSANDEPARLGWLFCGSHKKMLIVEFLIVD